jgi:hypothetical protein
MQLRYVARGDRGFEIMIGTLLFVAVFWVSPVFVARRMLMDKGYTSGQGIALGLLLGWIGVLIAAILRRKTPAFGGPMVGTTRICPYCAEQIQRAATVCRFCQRDVEALDPMPTPPNWPPSPGGN